MYDHGPAVCAASACSATAAVTMLPNTGGTEILLQLAISIAAGMLAWGLFYAYAQKRLAKIKR